MTVTVHQCTVSSGRRMEVDGEMCLTVIVPVGLRILRLYVPESQREDAARLLRVLGVGSIRDAGGRTCRVSVTGNSASVSDPGTGKTVWMYVRTFRPEVRA